MEQNAMASGKSFFFSFYVWHKVRRSKELILESNP